MGAAASAVADGELLYVHGEWTESERALLICDLELAASTFGLVALQPELELRNVYSFTDNTVAMAAMRTMAPSTAAMQQLTAARVGHRKAVEQLRPRTQRLREASAEISAAQREKLERRAEAIL